MDYKIEITPRIEDLMKRLGADLEEGQKFGMTNVIETANALTKEEESPHAITSNLVNSITSYLQNKGRKGVLIATAKYAAAVHEGSKPHDIVAKKAKALFWPGGKHPVKKVHHPGFRGRPFFHIALGRMNLAATYDEGIANFLRKRGW